MKTRDVLDHLKVEDDYWFVPKMFGYGATPVTWQGWALTAAYVLLLLLDVNRMPDLVAKVGIAVALTAVFLAITVRKTQGGWGWHWGPRK